ncbi:MAG TPA: hypothetical protein VFA18_15000 [Gemmataceae bacterium]|nr:hypothetical protein [Gemmataceae bacterium]
MPAQTIILNSRERFGSRVPSQALGGVLERIPGAVRQSVRMAIEGRSRAHGPRPAWLQAATDIRFLGHQGDDQTVLRFEVPTLGEAAPRLYEQQELLPTMPAAENTGFDILADVFRDVASRNADSDRFDRPLLDSLAGFRKVLNGTFTEMVVPTQRTPKQPVVVTSQVAEIARSLYTHTPPPQRIRLVGRLDMVRVSTQSFGLILDDRQEVRGVTVNGDIESVGSLINQRVLVLGKAVYRPSARLLRVDAEEVVKTTEEGSFFSAIPRAVRRPFELRDALRQPNKGGVTAIIGQWPGDETDEEIRQALRELS